MSGIIFSLPLSPWTHLLALLLSLAQWLRFGNPFWKILFIV